MRHWIFVLFVFVGHVAILWAEPFDQAEVTKSINLVSLLPQDTLALPGDVVKGNMALKSGSNSRAELEFPDLTIARVGSNALFCFIAGEREMVLDSGTMLFSSPRGAGEGNVQAGAITAAVTGSAAAVTGSDFLISNIGARIKVICLSHGVFAYFTENPKIRVVLLSRNELVARRMEVLPSCTGALIRNSKDVSTRSGHRSRRRPAHYRQATRSSVGHCHRLRQ